MVTKAAPLDSSPTTASPSQLPANAPGKAAEGSPRAGALPATRETQMKFQAQPDPAQLLQALESSEHMKDSPSLCPLAVTLPSALVQVESVLVTQVGPKWGRGRDWAACVDTGSP